MNVENLLSRLQLVRPTRGGWSARCPAHADRSPSLSIGVSDEKILLHCFAGCSTEAICSALRISIHELFCRPRRARRPEPQCLRAAKHEIARLRARLTPGERERQITVVMADRENAEGAIARALALAVEGELVQVALENEDR